MIDGFNWKAVTVAVAILAAATAFCVLYARLQDARFEANAAKQATTAKQIELDTARAELETAKAELATTHTAMQRAYDAIQTANTKIAEATNEHVERIQQIDDGGGDWLQCALPDSVRDAFTCRDSGNTAPDGGNANTVR